MLYSGSVCLSQGVYTAVSIIFKYASKRRSFSSPGLGFMIIDFPYTLAEFSNPEMLWAYMAVSAMRAGYWPEGFMVAYA